MEVRDQIIQIIYKAIDDVNLILLEDQQLKKSLDETLFGGDKVDSLTVINLLVVVEDKLNNKIQKEILLIDNILMMEEISSISIYFFSISGLYFTEYPIS